jgi:hypothetical protein
MHNLWICLHVCFNFGGPKWQSSLAHVTFFHSLLRFYFLHLPDPMLSAGITTYCHPSVAPKSTFKRDNMGRDVRLSDKWTVHSISTNTFLPRHGLYIPPSIS